MCFGEILGRVSRMLWPRLLAAPWSPAEFPQYCLRTGSASQVRWQHASDLQTCASPLGCCGGVLVNVKLLCWSGACPRCAGVWQCGCQLEAQKLQPVDLAIRFVGVSCCILPADAFCLCFASAGWTAPLVLLTGVLQVCAGGWLESARCPCAYVMNICMRSPACALFSQPRSRQWAGVVSHGAW